MSKTEENFKAAVKSILLEKGIEEAIIFIKARHIPEPEDFLFKHFGVTYLREEITIETLEDAEDDIPSIAPLSTRPRYHAPDEPLDMEEDVDILAAEEKHKKPFFKRLFRK